MGIIYILRSFIDGKCYVGQTTTSLKRRMTSHRARRDSAVGGLIKQYGQGIFEIFTFSGIPKKLMNVLEKEMTQRLGSLEPNGFNIDLGRSKRFSDATRRKFSAKRAGSGNPMYGRRGALSPLFGRTYSPEHCRHISESQKGHTRSFAGFGPDNSMFGKHHSEEARAKMSATRKGSKNGFFGKHHSEETKAKMKAARIKRREK